MSDKTEVLYNGCYGGFNLSNEASMEINKRLQDNEKKVDKRLHLKYRFHPVCLQVYHLLGQEKFSGKNSHILIDVVDTKYKDFITIENYDGLENIQIDVNEYNLHKIKENIDSTSLSDSEKIEEIKKILNSGISSFDLIN